MELEDLKKQWESTNNPVQIKPLLTPEIIAQIIQKKYQANMNKIKYSELTGAVICLFGLCFLAVRFNELDSLAMQLVAVSTMLLLLIISVLSYVSTKQLSATGAIDKSYVESIKQFANRKLNFLKYQKLNAFLCYLLMVATIILLPKFFYGKDIAFSKTFWMFAFSFGYIFLLFFSKWVQKFYGNSLRQAEELLKELDK